MTIYEKAKSLVTAREAAEHYGLTVNSHGRDFCCLKGSLTPTLTLIRENELFRTARETPTMSILVYIVSPQPQSTTHYY